MILAHPMLADVDFDVQDLDRLHVLVIAPEHALDPRDHLIDRKGLHDIIVRPHQQPLHLVVHRVFSRDEYRGDPLRRDVFHERIAIDLRQHDVQKDQIICPSFDLIRGRLAVRRPVAVISCPPQVHHDQLRNCPFVFCDQHPHIYSPPSHVIPLLYLTCILPDQYSISL